jgi:hypothetical protein
MTRAWTVTWFTNQMSASTRKCLKMICVRSDLTCTPNEPSINQEWQQISYSTALCHAAPGSWRWSWISTRSTAIRFAVLNSCTRNKSMSSARRITWAVRSRKERSNITNHARMFFRASKTRICSDTTELHSLYLPRSGWGFELLGWVCWRRHVARSIMQMR